MPNKTKSNRKACFLPSVVLFWVEQGKVPPRKKERSRAQKKPPPKRRRPQNKKFSGLNYFQCKDTNFSEIDKARYFFSLLLFVWIVEISRGTAPPQCGQTTEGGAGGANNSATDTPKMFANFSSTAGEGKTRPEIYALNDWGDTPTPAATTRRGKPFIFAISLILRVIIPQKYGQNAKTPKERANKWKSKMKTPTKRESKNVICSVEDL